ncbi:adhesion G protein-coupled receptor L3-like [Rhopilema esculentum]|uniref:adhesion G protein-coupled receptor L3-like n=1 Tax=Rhopilema esculentum TaxID=499914 RepID=UPI0031DFC4CA
MTSVLLRPHQPPWILLHRNPQRKKTATRDSPSFRKVVFCQEEKEWLQCPMYRVIKINKAFWGRKDHTSCSDKAVTRTLKTEKLCAQDEANTMKKVETMCNDEEACELVASETFFDRADCPDVYKYVELEYECLHREMRIKETGSS